jgi:hypothetical protein
MRFVPIKSAEQQATLMLHKTRELLVKQRTMSVTRFLTENQWPGKIHLILSVKNRGEYLFQEEIAALCGRNDRLNVVVAMTDPKEAMWPGPKGRIDKALLASIVPDIAARRIHLCGPAAMMEAVTVALVDLGAPPERIQKEAFGTDTRDPTRKLASTKRMLGRVAFQMSQVSVPIFKNDKGECLHRQCLSLGHLRRVSRQAAFGQGPDACSGFPCRGRESRRVYSRLPGARRGRPCRRVIGGRRVARRDHLFRRLRNRRGGHRTPFLPCRGHAAATRNPRTAALGAGHCHSVCHRQWRPPSLHHDGRWPHIGSLAQAAPAGMGRCVIAGRMKRMHPASV